VDLAALFLLLVLVALLNPVALLALLDPVALLALVDPLVLVDLVDPLVLVDLEALVDICIYKDGRNNVGRNAMGVDESMDAGEAMDMVAKDAVVDKSSS